MLGALNRAFVPVLDHLVCFKTELGLCLQRLVESYNILILKQFHTMAIVNDAKSHELDSKIEEETRKIESLKKN